MFQNPMYEFVHETCSISLHVTPTLVKLWRGQQLLIQTDKATDPILNCDAVQILNSFQSVDIKIYCILK